MVAGLAGQVGRGFHQEPAGRVLSAECMSAHRCGAWRCECVCAGPTKTPRQQSGQREPHSLLRGAASGLEEGSGQ